MEDALDRFAVLDHLLDARGRPRGKYLLAYGAPWPGAENAVQDGAHTTFGIFVK
jgi:hypothetical protein